MIEYAEGKTLEQLMNENPDKLEEYMEKFVDLQLSMHEKKAPRLTLQKDKFARKIESMKDKLDATVRYELLTRLDSMPNHTKLCHGDFNPSNVIVAEDGTMKIVDWSHATQGNASGDAAICTEMASDCGGSPAYQRCKRGRRVPASLDRHH